MITNSASNDQVHTQQTSEDSTHADNTETPILTSTTQHDRTHSSEPNTLPSSFTNETVQASKPTFPNGSAPNFHDTEQHKGKHCYAVRCTQRTQQHLSHEGNKLTDTQCITKQSIDEERPEGGASTSETNQISGEGSQPLVANEMNTLFTYGPTNNFHNTNPIRKSEQRVFNATTATHEINSTSTMVYPEGLQVYERDVPFETIELKAEDREG